MEEDTGKSLHVGGSTGRIHGADYSLVDYNRAGIPLIEIVTKPIMGAREKAPAVARAYVGHLRELLLGLGVSDVRMEQGSLRCDVNLSLAPAGTGELGTRTETKNVNSLRSVERAARYEIGRQAAILAGGGSILQETRHWHEDTGITTSGREKSDAEDYRYFPEPDLDPGRALAASGSRSCAPRCPSRRASAGPGCRPSGASPTSRCATPSVPGRSAWSRRPSPPAPVPQSARKWWLSELARRANEQSTEISALPITPADVARIQALVDDGSINDKLARQVFDGVLAGEGTPDEVVAARGLAIVSDEGALGDAVDRAIEANPDVADKIRDGKVAAAGALIGAVMKEMRGQADAGRVRELILERLS